MTSPDEKSRLINFENKVESKSIPSYNSLLSSTKAIEANQSMSLSHCHSSNRDTGIDKQALKKLIFTSTLCLVFMTAEVVGGLLANSLAIASDAAHLLTDFAGFMISLFSIWMATRPASSRMSFGWHRAEVIGALTSVLLIWVVTGVLCYLAVQRIINKNYEIDAVIMAITASIGVVVNIIMGLALTVGGAPVGQSQGQNNDNNDPDIEHKVEVKKNNINVRAAFVHILGDFVQSVGVVVAALIIYFKPEYSIVDPLCTFLFSILVLMTTSYIIRDVLKVLMEGTPQAVNFFDVQRALFDIPGVIKVHSLRIWSLSMDKTAISTHLAIAKGENPTKILNMASHEMNIRFDIYELTIQVEEYRDKMEECQQCQTPKF